MAPGTVRLALAACEDAGLIHSITQAAYAEYRGVLHPPSGVDREQVADVERALHEGGAVLAWVGDTAVAAARFQQAADYLSVERIAVIPTARGQGIARALLAYLEELARRCHLREVRLGVRLSIPRNMDLYRRFGYQILSLHPYPRGTDTWALLAKPAEDAQDDGPG